MTDQALIDALRDPRCYPHPVQHLQLIETHISWVVLTGSYAYKLKKPVNLGFLDFRTLAARRFYCEEELRLNRRLEAGLYLDVVTVNQGLKGPEIGGPGPVVEYAVKMRQFGQEGLLDRVQERGDLLPSHVDALARQIAEFHGTCERVPAGGRFGSPDSITLPARQNFEQIAALGPDADHGQIGQLLQELLDWTGRCGAALEEMFRTRQKDGFVRECHGDLHLGNAFIENGTIRIFDCIEFSASLRWIDVMSDVAFMMMDLWHRNHPDLARRFLNAYLALTGDYGGLATLSYYLVYRAMVRAKVALIRSNQPGVGQAERALDQAEFRRFLALARQFSVPRQVWVALTHGVSGSGKSHFAQQLLERSDAIRIRSDIERKRLLSLPGDAATDSPLGAGLYSEPATRSTYERLSALVATVLDAGWPVIADAAFIERWQRELAREPARRRRVPLLILDFRATPAALRARILQRAAQGADPSEANLAVLEHQLRTQRPLGDDEGPAAAAIDTEAGGGLDAVTRVLRRLVAAGASEP